MKIGNRRASFINYRNPGIFMITVNKRKGMPPFSRLVQKKEASFGLEGSDIGVRYFDLGFIIYHTLKDFNSLTPSIEIRQYVIMPDHLHILLQITKEMQKPLGDAIAAFKRRISIQAHESGLTLNGINGIFEPGFNDQYLRYDRSLNDIYQYIKKNPERLWKIKQNPEFFTSQRNRILNGRRCQLYGNLNLLANPFKSAVVVHRRDSAEELNRKKELWRYVLMNGGVLVGAFVAPAEKAIFMGAAKYGGKIILISNKAYSNREKPHKKLYELCAKGQLLIITPEMTPALPLSPSWTPKSHSPKTAVSQSPAWAPKSQKKKPISREECLQFNAFAEALAGAPTSAD